MTQEAEAKRIAELRLAKARKIAARYMRCRASCEDRRGRPHVARSERYVADRTLDGLCDDGSTMRRVRALLLEKEGEA